MKRFRMKIDARTEYIFNDGTIDKPDVSFEKEILINREEATEDFYNAIFTFLRDELLATFLNKTDSNPAISIRKEKNEI
jgi:hypothetical protein